MLTGCPKLFLVGLALLAAALGGCTDITGRGPAPLDQTLAGKIEEHPRVGHVYCMRGWLGIFSTGMDQLAVRIDKEVGATAVSVANEEWQKLRDFIIEQKQKQKIREPLVLLGHSYGADDQIRVAEALKEKKIEVDLLVLFDPVTPPAVPTNVKRVYCVYKSRPLTDALPVWRGVPVTVVNPKLTQLTNIDLRLTDVGFNTAPIDHINIEKTDGVHRMAMEEIKKVCPLRPGVMARKVVTPVATPTPVAPISTPTSPN